jgi:hypothetical protein
MAPKTFPPRTGAPPSAFLFLVLFLFPLSSFLFPLYSFLFILSSLFVSFSFSFSFFVKCGQGERERMRTEKEERGRGKIPAGGRWRGRPPASKENFVALHGGLVLFQAFFGTGP